MGLNRIFLGTLTGGLTFFFSGWFMYTVVFRDFMEHNLGPAENIVKNPMDVPAILTSNLSWGLLLAVLLLRWTNPQTLRSATEKCLIIGLLTSVFMDFSFYGTTNAMNFAETLVDVFIITSTTVLSGAALVYVDPKWGSKIGA